jgi:hypothetical protein
MIEVLEDRLDSSPMLVSEAPCLGSTALSPLPQTDIDMIRQWMSRGCPMIVGTSEAVIGALERRNF